MPAKKTKQSSSSKTVERPSKEQRAEIRAAAVEAAGGVEQLHWLWKSEPAKQSSTYEEAPAVDYRTRRLAVAGLGLGWLLVALALTDIISVTRIMML
jgi:hypothetical protein